MTRTGLVVLFCFLFVLVYGSPSVDWFDHSRLVKPRVAANRRTLHIDLTGDGVETAVELGPATLFHDNFEAQTVAPDGKPISFQTNAAEYLREVQHEGLAGLVLFKNNQSIGVIQTPDSTLFIEPTPEDNDDHVILHRWKGDANSYQSRKIPYEQKTSKIQKSINFWNKVRNSKLLREEKEKMAKRQAVDYSITTWMFMDYEVFTGICGEDVDDCVAAAALTLGMARVVFDNTAWNTIDTLVPKLRGVTVWNTGNPSGCPMTTPCSTCSDSLDRCTSWLDGVKDDYAADEVDAYAIIPGSRKWVEANDDSTVGIAWLDVICYGWTNFDGPVSISSAHQGLYGAALTLAHEMGHNLGAPHPSSSACYYHIMDSSDTDIARFSSCSVNAIESYLDTQSTCLDDTFTQSAEYVPPEECLPAPGRCATGNIICQADGWEGGDSGCDHLHDCKRYWCDAITFCSGVEVPNGFQYSDCEGSNACYDGECVATSTIPGWSSMDGSCSLAECTDGVFMDVPEADIPVPAPATNGAGNDDRFVWTTANTECPSAFYDALYDADYGWESCDKDISYFSDDEREQAACEALACWGEHFIDSSFFDDACDKNNDCPAPEDYSPYITIDGENFDLSDCNADLCSGDTGDTAVRALPRPVLPICAAVVLD